MTPKEAFNEYKQTALDFAKGEYDNYSPYIKHGNNLLEIAPIIEHALTELEELKQRDTPMKWIDVVDDTGHYDKCPVCGYPSYNDLGHNHFCTVCGQRLEFDEKVGTEE